MRIVLATDTIAGDKKEAPENTGADGHARKSGIFNFNNICIAGLTVGVTTCHNNGISFF